MYLPLFLLVPCKTWRFQVDHVRTLVFLSMGSTDFKNTVCLLLKFWRPGINLVVMKCKIDCTSDVINDSNKLFGINTLPLNEGLRPE